jgi:hypothetical protein
MTNTWVPTIRILCAVLGASVLQAGDFSSYRGFQFGMKLPAAVEQLGLKTTDAKLVHQRPALIQEVEWRPGSLTVVDAVKTDPVKDGVLYFYNGELYRIVITYDRYRVEGMSAEDMTEAISASYGIATKPAVEIPYHSNYGEVAPVLARWENAEYSYNLIRTGDQSSFAMALYSKRLDTLAQTSIVQAVRLEAQEAPQREIEKQEKQKADERIALEKARSVNKPNFLP